MFAFIIISKMVSNAIQSGDNKGGNKGEKYTGNDFSKRENIATLGEWRGEQ